VYVKQSRDSLAGDTALVCSPATRASDKQAARGHTGLALLRKQSVLAAHLAPGGRGRAVPYSGEEGRVSGRNRSSHHLQRISTCRTKGARGKRNRVSCYPCQRVLIHAHCLSLLLAGCSMLDPHAIACILTGIGCWCFPTPRSYDTALVLSWTSVSPDEFFVAGDAGPRVGVRRASGCGILQTRCVRAPAARALSQRGASQCTLQLA
jgi:hypothetical protein